MWQRIGRRQWPAPCINSPSPLSIQVNGQTISRHLYRNYGYTPQAGDQVLALRQGDAFYILMKVVPA